METSSGNYMCVLKQHDTNKTRIINDIFIATWNNQDPIYSRIILDIDGNCRARHSVIRNQVHMCYGFNTEHESVFVVFI